jgi:hypothetical protein
VSDEFEVGYGKPPKSTQFKPGHSGNAKGRPKGVRNFKTDVKKTLTTPIKVTTDGKSKKVSTQLAVLLRLREQALKGDAAEFESLFASLRKPEAVSLGVLKRISGLWNFLYITRTCVALQAGFEKVSCGCGLPAKKRSCVRIWRQLSLTLSVRRKSGYRPDGWAEADAKRRVVSDAQRLRCHSEWSWRKIRVSVHHFRQTGGRKPRICHENLRSP